MSALLPPPMRLRTDASSRPAGWPVALGALGFALAAVLLLYRETALAMVGIWIRSETFTHAFLVLPIVLWLVWRDRARLAAITPRAEPWMLLPIAAVGFAWLLGDLAAVNAVAQFALVAMLVLAVPAVLGWPLARAAIFPLAFLFFAVPFGEFLLPVLMQGTADFTIAALRLSGVPVFREGLNFVIPSGSWSVVEACSGVRYLIASFMVGTLYAYLTYRSTRRRLAFMAVSLALPLLANWVRAYGIVMLGHLSGNEIATGVDHLVYGWLFFGVVIFLLFLVGARWAEPAAPRTATAEVSRPVRAGAPPRMALVAAVLAAIAAVPPMVLRSIEAGESTGAPSLAVPAAPGDGWQPAPEAATADWQPRLGDPSATASGAYARAGSPAVRLQLAYYRRQGSERKPVDPALTLTRSDDKRWLAAGEGRRVLTLGDGRALAVRSAALRPQTSGDLDRLLVPWQLAWVNGRFVDGDAAAKAQIAFDRLLGRGDDSAVVLLWALQTTPGAAEQALEAFLRANLGAIEAQLRLARGAP